MVPHDSIILEFRHYQLSETSACQEIVRNFYAILLELNRQFEQQDPCQVSSQEFAAWPRSS